MRSPAEILDQAKLAERTVSLYLGGDRDLQLRYEELERRLPFAKEAAPDSLGEGSKVRAIEEEMVAIRAEMEPSIVDFRLRAMRRKDFRDFRDQHQPRKDADGNTHPEDVTVGANTDTIWEPLVRAAIVEPEFTDEQMTHLLEEVLTDAQFEELALAAYDLNRGRADVPFSSAASRGKRNSATA